MKTDRPESKPAAEHAAALSRRDPKRDGARKTREIALRGIPIAPGVAIGPLYDTAEIPPETPRRTVPAEAVEPERARLADAVSLSRKQIGKLKTKLALLPDAAQHELAPLLEVGPGQAALHACTEGLD